MGICRRRKLVKFTEIKDWRTQRSNASQWIVLDGIQVSHLHLNFHFLNWYSSDWVTIFDSFDICHIPSSSNPDNEEPCFHREERCTGQFGPYTTITFQDRFQSRNAYNFSGIPNAQYWNRFKVESWCKKKYFPSNPFGHPGILYQ